MANVADRIVEILEAANVRRIYGLVGDSLNGITESLRVRDKIEWMPVRHEEVAAFAAGAEAQLTGELTVCAGSCGPGNLHLINGLFDCHRSRAPVLAIAAHIPSTEIGTDYFQATHPEILFKECSHYVELVSNPSLVPQILERAMRIAIAKKGVAIVVIPGDVALKPLKASLPAWIAPEQPDLRPNPDELLRLADILNGASRVSMLCGAGCAGAHAEVLALAGKLKAPIVHALRGKEHVEYDNPYDVGMTGFIGFSSGYAAMKQCDVLLMLGTDFPYRQFYPEHARIVQVDIRPEALGNRCQLTLGLLGDVRQTLLALEPHLVESGPNSTVIHPQYVTRLVSELATDDAVFTCDVGTPTVWAARYLKMNGQRRLLGSFNHGSMANALLQAIGAQAAFPGRQVISLSGDGGFSMMMGDFITLTQNGLPIKVVVLNNGTLGFVEMEMKANGFLDTGCDLKNPNFAAMAEAMGIKTIRVETTQNLREAPTEALSHDGRALIDVVSARQELVIPPKPTFDQARHFNLFMIKAIPNGRADV